jgi:Replication-relaxation
MSAERIDWRRIAVAFVFPPNIPLIKACQECGPKRTAPIAAPLFDLVGVAAASGTPLMLGSFRPARQATRRRLTVLDLPRRHRACLRILLRAKVATTQHLTDLVYHRRQTTQLRLMRLWQAGFIERATLPPLTRGGAPLVFCLSRRGRARLGYRPLARAEAGMQLRHDLHVLDAVCALARPDPRALGGYPLAAWCTPAMSQRFIDSVMPDAPLALQLNRGCAVLALEVDEGTEHAPVIRGKLARYAAALDQREGWHLVFVAGETERARWLEALARRTEGLDSMSGHGWVATIDQLRRRGTHADLMPLEARRPGARVADLCEIGSHGRIRHPVGSDAWIRLMASGAGEDFVVVFRERDRQE